LIRELVLRIATWLIDSGCARLDSGEVDERRLEWMGELEFILYDRTGGWLPAIRFAYGCRRASARLASPSSAPREYMLDVSVLGVRARARLTRARQGISRSRYEAAFVVPGASAAVLIEAGVCVETKVRLPGIRLEMRASLNGEGTQ
jgi:hypothetical protein